jgi:hypothetical protein
MDDASMQDTLEKSKEFFDGGGFEFLSDLELKYNCASMC